MTNDALRQHQGRVDGPGWFRLLGSGWATLLLAGLTATLSQYAAIAMQDGVVLGPSGWSTGGFVAVVSALGMWAWARSWQRFKLAIWIPVVLVSAISFLAVGLEAGNIAGSGAAAAPAPSTAAASAQSEAQPQEVRLSYQQTAAYLLGEVAPPAPSGPQYQCAKLGPNVSWSVTSYRQDARSAGAVLDYQAWIDFYEAYEERYCRYPEPAGFTALELQAAVQSTPIGPFGV